MSENTTPVEFDGKIRVAARVIDFLSSGLYQSPGSCLKELINNSYDADATEVVVSVKPDADFVAIEDNGEGMTREQFERHFSNVAESHKRDNGERTTSDRREKIGKIGIGFIAANELCDEMEIYSTCAGSEDLLHVIIDFGEIRNRSFQDRRSEDGTVEKGDYHGEILQSPADAQYTKIYLKRLRDSARRALVSPSPELENMPIHTLYGKKPTTARNEIVSLKSFSDLDLYSQTRTAVALNIPVPYSENWAPEEYKQELAPFTRRAEALEFTVLYDGVELEKPIVLTPAEDGKSFLRRVRYSGEHINVEGYLYARHGVFRPVELNGVLIRIREAAVGDYDRRFLGFPNNVSQLFQNWVSGELYVDGLEDALNIDRRTLREVSPSYVELRAWFKEEFSLFLREVHRELYSSSSQQRGTTKARSQVKQVKAISEQVRERIGSGAADAINQALSPSRKKPSTRGEQLFDDATAIGAKNEEEALSALLSDPSSLRRLNRRYSVSEILELVAQVAADELPKEQATAFLTAFVRRLRG